MSEKKDHQKKTFSMSSYRDYLLKLQWEYEQMCNVKNVVAPDMMYTFINFAVTAWHMTDWIKGELGEGGFQNISGQSQAVEMYVLQNEYIAVCREIANASKHFEIKRKPNDSISTVPARAGAEYPDAEEGELLFWVITVNGSIWTLFKVADEALSYWKCFCEKYLSSESTAELSAS